VPNTRSAAKALRVSQRRHLRNKSTKSAVKTYFRNAEEQIADISKSSAQATLAQLPKEDAEQQIAGAVESSVAAMRVAVAAIDRAANKGIIHKNSAARRKSRLMKHLNAVQAQAATAAAAPVAPEPAKRASRTGAKSGAKSATKPAAKPRTRAKKS
jgi:small subunit ribosomal protein S20